MVENALRADPYVEKNIQQSLKIVCSLADKVTFATHQNDIAVIADLSVTSTCPEAIDNLELVLECEPAIIGKKSWKLDRIAPSGEIRIRDRNVSLSGSLLADLNERMRAEVKLSLQKDGIILTETRQTITGLARNEWGGASCMPELLAAFVMPNDPAVSTILKQAGDILRSAGHQPALDGYQSRSRQRVWQIAAAIWSAISNRRLVYAEPPASFEREGQKIRMPSEILSTGLATCLDSTVLFAAALEQAGLNPIIAFTQGHAFCGVWLQPQQLSTLTTDDCSELRKYIALKELAIFETTLVVNEPSIHFSKAIAEGNRRLSEDNENDFVYAIDIKRARRQQITPLSISIKKAEFNGSDEIGAPLIQGIEEAPDLPGFDLGVDDAPIPDSPETRLDHWKRKLLDLTKRNRLLNLKPSKTAIKLYCSDSAVLEDKLAEGKKITVIPMAKLSGEKNERDNSLFTSRTGDDFTKRFIEDALERDEIVSELGQTELDAGLIELYRKSKTDMQEGGANTLYLALGILKWKQSENEERSYRAPLILVPIKLERKSAASRVKITHHEDEPVFNMTLLEMLRQDFDLRMPELEDELPKDHSGIDVSKVWGIVRKAIRDIPGFEVTEEIVISTFSFAKYLMWKDLAERTDTLKQSQFVHHLIENPRDTYSNSATFMRPNEIDEKIDPSQLFMPLSADSSQIVAVHASAGKGDFILEGPPGTGKSQTIGNIIAHNLALGKKVLFVSEKMAALEVVYKRLREKGLGDFCLELHSNKANKRHVLDQLAQSWHNRETKSQQEWQLEADRLKKLRDDLNALVKSLHTPGHSGVSPRNAIGRSVKWQNIHRVRLDWDGGLDADKATDRDKLSKLEDISKRLGQNFAEISTEDKAAFDGISYKDWSNAWQQDLVNASQKLLVAINELEQSLSSFLRQASIQISDINPTKIKALSDFAKIIPSLAKKNIEFAFDSNYALTFNNLESALGHLKLYRDAKERLSTTYPDDAISNLLIEDWKRKWSEAAASFWPVFYIKTWIVTRKAKKAFGLSSSPHLGNDLSVLEELSQIYKEMKGFSDNVSENTSWRGLETNIENVQEILSTAKNVREFIGRVSSDINDLPEIKSSTKRLCVDGQELLHDGMPISDAAKNFHEDFLKYSEKTTQFLTIGEVSQDLNSNLDALKAKLNSIVSLQPRINAWCRWQASSNEAKINGLSSLVHALETGLVSADQSEEAFKTAYCIWLAQRLIDSRYELRTFSALEHEEKIKAFRNIDQKVSDLSIDYIRAKLSANIPHPESQSRPAGYGILSRELQKRMRHKPVRQLVSEMGESLTALTPCILMSPLSVAQFLAADNQLFDLVVFDEASQITVWDAIGAIARGKNVIVVGDPKQMPPTSFFDRAASEDSDDDNNMDDLESILDEALAASVRLHRLTGHYRSKHESLIAFSNHRYYSGELVTYPSSETKQSAVSLENVNGTYQRGRGRTNPEEAKAIVREIIRRLNDPALSKYSIGVVALNSEQQRLVDDLLDQERRKDPELEKFFNDDAEEPVFVKNLETVQGDQRDVILLSIGYGPDTPGAKTMSMNFGPLNRKGGERRLNVAITRATSEVVIFSSFDPSMIDLTRTSAQAVRDLKHYMEFAQRGPSALGDAVLSTSGLYGYDSDFEESVAEALRNKGWNIHTQIGVSKFRVDLGVVHPDYPGRYLAGIECDGATYHSSPLVNPHFRVHSLSYSLAVAAA